MSDKAILKWQSGSIDFSHGTVVMGIVNVTGDSFSDEGMYLDVDKAVAHGVEMAKAGAVIIDIGPESTRPGAEPVGVDEQIKRAIPVIEKLSKQTDAVISIDTRCVEVAAAAIDAGASMINDVTALTDDTMAVLAAERKVPVVLMHMKGDPTNMQKSPSYDDVTEEVLAYLLERAHRAESFGVAKNMIFIDPGIGFGKTVEHNLQLMRDMDKFVATGFGLLMGTSRKRFIGELTSKDVPADRVFGTAATVALAAGAGVAIVRVHDVAEMVDVVKVVNAMTFRQAY